MIYLTITIDVEPDCTPTWHYSNPLRFNGVKVGIKEILQPLFNKYNVKPTYLINNVVLEDKESVETFKNLKGEFELGTHLHSEFIEPGKIFSDYAGKKGEMNQCFLNPEIEFEKLNNITKLFADNFGFMPKAFRAGRFSAGNNTIKCLKSLGYKVDTSVTPNINWCDKTREGNVDFTNAPVQPYHISDNNILKEDNNGSILEVPVTIINIKKIFRTRLQWLRPHYSDYSDFRKIFYTMKRKYKNKMLVLNMMFHNVEVIPNISPYTSSEAEVAEYLKSLEKFLQLMQKYNVKGATISEIYELSGK
jgi:hypothetical protein